MSGETGRLELGLGSAGKDRGTHSDEDVAVSRGTGASEKQTFLFLNRKIQ